jgi:hypothetical protein
MNARIAQMLSLVHWGNYHLSGYEIRQNQIDSNPNFTFFQAIQFHQFKEFFLDIDVDLSIKADSILNWFRYLKESDVLKLRLVPNPSPKQDDDFLIQAQFKDYVQYWTVRWELTHPNNANDNIWTVIYVTNTKQLKLEIPEVNEPQLQKECSMLFLQLQMLTTLLELPTWPILFQEAEQLTHATEFINSNLFPNNFLSPEKSGLLLAVQKIYILDAANPWHDIVLSNNNQEELYAKLTHQLKEFIKLALVNSTLYNEF